LLQLQLIGSLVGKQVCSKLKVKIVMMNFLVGAKRHVFFSAGFGLLLIFGIIYWSKYDISNHPDESVKIKLPRPNRDVEQKIVGQKVSSQTRGEEISLAGRSKESLINEINDLSNLKLRFQRFAQWCEKDDISWEVLWEIAMEANFGSQDMFLDLLNTMCACRSNIQNMDLFKARILSEFGRGVNRDELMGSLAASVVHNESIAKINDIFEFLRPEDESYDKDRVTECILIGLWGKDTDEIFNFFRSDPASHQALLKTTKTIQAFSNLLTPANSSNDGKPWEGVIRKSVEFINSSSLDDGVKDQILLNIAASTVNNDPISIWELLTTNLKSPENIELGVGAEKLAIVAKTMTEVAKPAESFRLLVGSELVPSNVQREAFASWIVKDGEDAHQWFEESSVSMGPELRQSYVAGFVDAALQRREIETANEWISELENANLKEELQNKVLSLEKSEKR
jgi:hypothetical protein